MSALHDGAAMFEEHAGPQFGILALLEAMDPISADSLSHTGWIEWVILPAGFEVELDVSYPDGYAGRIMNDQQVAVKQWVHPLRPRPAGLMNRPKEGSPTSGVQASRVPSIFGFRLFGWSAMLGFP